MHGFEEDEEQKDGLVRVQRGFENWWDLQWKMKNESEEAQ